MVIPAANQASAVLGDIRVPPSTAWACLTQGSAEVTSICSEVTPRPCSAFAETATTWPCHRSPHHRIVAVVASVQEFGHGQRRDRLAAVEEPGPVADLPPTVVLFVSNCDDPAVYLQVHRVVVDLDRHEKASPVPAEPREPIRGACAFRLSRARRDPPGR